LEHAPSAREKRVRLEEVGNASTRDGERLVRRGVRLHAIALEYYGFMSRARGGERSGKPGDTATGDNDPHCATLDRLMPSVISKTGSVDDRLPERKLTG
jgi:hypothetical protein